VSYSAGIIFACLAMAVVVGMVYQALSYAHGRQLISRRQLVLRLSAGTLLLGTIGLVFYAAFQHFTNPVTALVYWGLLTLLPVIVVILAWMDLRELARTQHVRQAELYRSLADIEREAKRKRSDDT
jgi:hypothetical protein